MLVSSEPHRVLLLGGALLALGGICLFVGGNHAGRRLRPSVNPDPSTTKALARSSEDPKELALPIEIVEASAPARVREPAPVELDVLPIQGQLGRREEVIPIQKDGDFYVLNFSEDLEDRLNLEEFVKICQEVTGRNFTYSDQTGAKLKAAPLVMYGSKRILKENFYSFFQSQMFINDFVCGEVGPPRIAVILIQSRQEGGNQNLNVKRCSKFVLPEELENYAYQPMRTITTVLYLPNTDVQKLSTDGDANTVQLLPAGEHAVILCGFGSHVVSLARALQARDAESPPRPRPRE